MTNSEKVINWRKRTKQRMVDAFNGECGVCKYRKFIGALEFHHLESDKKERGLSGMIVNPSSWIKIVKELKKCVCLCSTCHREVHGGITTLPHNISRFNEEFTEYRKVYAHEMDKCPICGIEKWAGQKTCSYKCAAQMARKYDWDRHDLKVLFIEKKMSMRAISRIVGCSDVAVKKRLKKLNLLFTGSSAR